MNISSVIIRTTPQSLDSILSQLKACDFCEYHLHNEQGHIIVTLEADTTQEELSYLQRIQGMEGVLSTDLQMSYNEAELDGQIERMEGSDIVPAVLNDDDIDPNDIIYRGNIVKKDINDFADSFDKSSHKT